MNESFTEAGKVIMSMQMRQEAGWGTRRCLTDWMMSVAQQQRKFFSWSCCSRVSTLFSGFRDEFVVSLKYVANFWKVIMAVAFVLML